MRPCLRSSQPEVDARNVVGDVGDRLFGLETGHAGQRLQDVGGARLEPFASVQGLGCRDRAFRRRRGATRGQARRLVAASLRTRALDDGQARAMGVGDRGTGKLVEPRMP